jgi:branched-chain amino acid transport system permease protein
MQYWINILNSALIFAIWTASLSVLMGTAGLLAIAPCGIGAVGGFVGGYLAVNDGWSFLSVLILGLAIGVVVGCLIGIPALRLGRDHVILLTLAFGVVVVAIIPLIPALDASTGLQGVPFIDFFGKLESPTQLLRLLIPIAVVCYLVCWRISSSPFGRVLRGIREDEVATQALGKNVVRMKVITFAATAALASLAGVLSVYYNQIATLGQFGFDTTILIVAGLIVGGSGSLGGAFVGALLVSFIGPVLQRVVSVSPDKASLWQPIIFGALLIIVVRFWPEGLIPEGVWSRLGARLARCAAATPADHPAPVAEPGGAEPPELAHSITLHPELVQPSEADLEDLRRASPSINGDGILVATDLAKWFGGIRAVDGLDIELRAGKITALLGPNGAGKTTVFNLLTGALRPDRGVVTLNGGDITGLRPYQVSQLGMTRSFQDVRILSRLTLLDNVMLAVPGQSGEGLATAFLRPGLVAKKESEVRERAHECLRFVGFDEHMDRWRAADLGYGDQKLLSIARMIATEAPVLLIDEPASGIDRRSLRPVLEVLERLREVGRAICLVEHNLDIVAGLADWVLFMESGKVTAQGTMTQITGQERLAQVYFGHHV